MLVKNVHSQNANQIFIFPIYLLYMIWKDIRAVFEPQIKYLDRVQIFFLYIQIPYIFSNFTGIGNRYILI